MVLPHTITSRVSQTSFRSLRPLASLHITPSRLYNTTTQQPPNNPNEQSTQGPKHKPPIPEVFLRAETLPIITHSFPAPHTGTIQLLFLNDPKTRNSISLRLLSALRSEVETLKLKNNPVTGHRALVIASSIPTASFCAGANLKERSTFTHQQTLEFLNQLRATAATIESLPIPTITCINGPALGGGLELALSTDFRVVGPRAKLGLPETRLGIIPGAGGTYRLPRLIGKHRALDLILSGRRIEFEEAYEIGLATRKAYEDPVGGTPRDIPELAVVEEVIPDAITDAAFLGGVKMAEEILSGGPVAVWVGKKVVGLQEEEAENLGYEVVVRTRDRNEALRAFVEKRDVKFVGE